MPQPNTLQKDSTSLTIGILGGGQLGMMLAQSALHLGYQCVFLEDADNPPAELYGRVYKSHELDDFIHASDIFSLEFENTPLDTAHVLNSHKGEIFPKANALAVAQDRLAEKSLFNELGIDTVPFLAVNSLDELRHACDSIG